MPWSLCYSMAHSSFSLHLEKIGTSFAPPQFSTKFSTLPKIWKDYLDALLLVRYGRVRSQYLILVLFFCTNVSQQKRMEPMLMVIWCQLGKEEDIWEMLEGRVALTVVQCVESEREIATLPGKCEGLRDLRDEVFVVDEEGQLCVEKMLLNECFINIRNQARFIRMGMTHLPWGCSIMTMLILAFCMLLFLVWVALFNWLF